MFSIELVTRAKYLYRALQYIVTFIRHQMVHLTT